MNYHNKSLICHGLATQIWVTIGSGNGLLSDDTKPLPKRMLTYHQRCFVALTRDQFTVLMNAIHNMCLEITPFKLLPHLPEANELTVSIWITWIKKTDNTTHSGETDEANCSWLHLVWPPPKRPDHNSTFYAVSGASMKLIFCIVVVVFYWPRVQANTKSNNNNRKVHIIHKRNQNNE